jgi:3-methyladenine DNA glycosylase/8-oxoguanine DNA glycosylase
MLTYRSVTPAPRSASVEAVSSLTDMLADPAPPPLRRTLRLRRPLDLRLTLGPLWLGRSDRTMRLDGATAWRATRTRDGPATLTVALDGTQEVTARAWGPGAATTLDNLPALLGEHDDDDGFVPQHRVVADLHRRFRGMRMTASHAVFEALVPTVLAQRVTSIEAHTAAVRLAARLGDAAPGPDETLRLPPSPQQVATLPSWDYHRLGIERQRADTLKRAARVAGRLEETATMPRPAAIDRLRSLPGIGPWTAAIVAARAFGDADAVPLGDYHIPHMVSWALRGEPRGSDERMLELLEPYRGHRARVIRLLLTGGFHEPRFGPRRPLRSIAAI